MRHPLVFFLMLSLTFILTAYGDDGKTQTCPSASAAVIGTAANRLELAVVNGDETNDICISTRSNMTCNGSGTDGHHWKPGTGPWFTEHSKASPVKTNWYCRAATSDVTIYITELY